MRHGKEYNLFDIRKGEYVLNKVQAREIKKFLDMPDLDVSTAYKRGRIFIGKYTLEIAGGEVRIGRREKRQISEDIFEEWARVTEDLRNRIEWVKKEDFIRDKRS